MKMPSLMMMKSLSGHARVTRQVLSAR